MKRTAHNSIHAKQFRPLALALSISAAFSPFSAQAGVTIEQQPLLVAKPVPPNVMFIIDDSGSMNDNEMCNPGFTNNCGSDLNSKAYTRNGLAYNPAQTYTPWATGDSSNPIMPDADRTAVSNSNVNISTANTDLTSSNQYFHVPKNITTGDTGNASLDRWILEKNGTKAHKCKTVTNNLSTISADCVEQSSFTWSLPDGGTITRSIAEEWQNYANWYHYYRGRMKMAKASTSHAFAALDERFRVGYRTINNNNTFAIPVGTDNGLFRGTNKTKFYDNLFKTGTPGWTPLRQSLSSVGEYFKQTDSDGPYGPESGSAQLSCRQNFAILTTDGEWNKAQAGKAEARANTDSNNGPTITNPKTGQSFTYKAEFPYKDKNSGTFTATGSNDDGTGTLADVAMYYWKNDLRTDMDNNVPVTPKNPAFWQHMRTFGISIGMYGTIQPEGPYPADGWANPTNASQKIDDLLHASINSRGEFIVASNPQEFTKALVNALNAIASETKSEASGGANSAELKAGTKVYFSRYTTGSWNGDIISYSVNATTGAQDQSAPVWEAEKKLPAWETRKIYVNVDGSAVKFEYDKLNEAQKTYLNADLVNYLRGDRSKEADKTGGTLRERAGVLPAFINSQLVYVGAPEQGEYYKKLTFTGASDYEAYVTNKQSRTPMLYIAGNNGMLHAFNAETGEETYAFLPNSSISNKLADYADKDYGSNQKTTKPHQYILDGELTVADAYLDDAWKTILVGTQGRGGTGVFALDITDPADIKFLWEKSAANDSALGNNLGKPIIAQVAEGDWRVILGNGPNSSGDKAQLILFNLKTGAITTADTGVGTNNGLAAVNAWDSDQDGFFDTAYAGDLQGNVWRFKNLSGTPTSAKLFSGGSDQPITAQPLVVKNMKTKATWVTIGSGRYLNKDDLDKTKFKTQTWYGLLDDGSSITSRGQLKQRKLLSSGSSGGVAVRTLESGTEYEITSSTTANRGWYIDFDLPADNGERMMTPNFILGGALFGISFTPDASNPCEPNGSSSIWVINPFSGARISQGVFDLNGDGKFDASDKLGTLYPSVLDGIPAVTSGAPPISVDTKKGSFSIHLPTADIQGRIPTGQASRQSWREVTAP